MPPETPKFEEELDPEKLFERIETFNNLRASGIPLRDAERYNSRSNDHIVLPKGDLKAQIDALVGYRQALEASDLPGGEHPLLREAKLQALTTMIQAARERFIRGTKLPSAEDPIKHIEAEDVLGGHDPESF